MTIPEFTLRQLLESGVHFGHQTQRWDPRMGEFIYGSRNGIHIIDLTQTVPLLDAALIAVRETVAKGGRVLFVGTKRQAAAPIAEAAEKCAQYYMNHRWLGGTLTNWQTVSKSINRLSELEESLGEGVEGLTKKERLGMERELTKLQASLGGIREMGGVPDLLFVVDVKKESLAVAEANKLGIPIVGIVDTNCSPEGVDYIVPGNDDAARAITLYCDLACRAALDGMSAQLGAAGVDLGENEDLPNENLVEDDPKKSESLEGQTINSLQTTKTSSSEDSSKVLKEKNSQEENVPPEETSGDLTKTDINNLPENEEKIPKKEIKKEKISSTNNPLEITNKNEKKQKDSPETKKVKEIKSPSKKSTEKQVK